MRRVARLGVVLAATATLLVATAWTPPPVGPIVRVLPWTDADFAEGIAFSATGDLYVGFGYTGDIVKVSRTGEVSHFANIDPTDNSITLGLAVDLRGNVYAAVWGFTEDLNGVWRITPHGQVARLAAMPLGTIPNALVFDRRGNLLVTDSTGAVWIVPKHGGAASEWVADELLAPLTDSGFGANGIARRGDQVVVLNSDKGSIVSIPILPDGRPGVPRLLVEDPLLRGADGVAFDLRGNMYVCIPGLPYTPASELLRVSQKGTIETLVVFPDDLTFITNPVFGHGRERTSVYLSNGDSLFGQDSVVKVDVGIPGQPVF